MRLESIKRTIIRSDCGHCSTGPKLVALQSRRRMICPIELSPKSSIAGPSVVLAVMLLTNCRGRALSSPPMRRTLAFALIGSAGCGHQSSQVAPSSPITAAELKHRVEIIANDSMGGRLPGSKGNIETTDYIAAEFKRLGLQPAGDSGGYFQYVPMISSRLDTTAHLTVNGAPLPFWTGVIPSNPSNAAIT